MERCLPQVRDQVRRRLGPALRGVLESEDLLQESLAQAFVSLGDFEPRHEGALFDWLAGIVERRIRDAARHAGREKRDRRREVPLAAQNGSQTSPAGIDPPDTERTPASAAALEEERAILLAALEQLPEKQREVVRLRNVERLPWPVVARMLGCPSPDAARMMYARALSALRGTLGREEGS